MSEHKIEAERRQPSYTGRRLLYAAIVVVVLAAAGGLVWKYYAPQKRTAKPVPVRPGKAPSAPASAVAEARNRPPRETRATVPAAGSTAGGPARPEQLEQTRNNLRADAAAAQSREAERQAQAAQKNGDAPAALAALRTALERQHESNRLHRRNTIEDIEREKQLELAVTRAEAEPFVREIDRLLNAAAMADRPAETMSALRTAEERQRALNQRFAGTPIASQARLEQIEEKIASATAGGLAAEIAEAGRVADAASAAGDQARAAEACIKAASLQRMINGNYPKSRFASSERLQALELRRETVLAESAVTLARALDREAAGLLRQGNPAAALEKVRVASARLEFATREHPRATENLGELRTRLDFIWLRRVDLGNLRTAVLALVRPVPGGGRARMLAAPVTQRLYIRVMNDNPSRSADPRLPVESVTWPEAKTFCTRLSWLLGLPVRLPTAAELSRAARDPAWPRSQAGAGRSLPAPVAVHPDESENFTEWLESAGQESSVAPVAGGGAPGLVPSLSAAATSVLREKTLRSRLIGFRIVLPSP